jgi:hypothetical protein
VEINIKELIIDLNINKKIPPVLGGGGELTSYGFTKIISSTEKQNALL